MTSRLVGKTPLTNALIFLTWTVTSFLCHQCAKSFLASADSITQAKGVDLWSNLWSAAIITLFQIVFCHCCIEVNHGKETSVLNVARITHILATFTTNVSMAMMFASNTFAIKLMEPITSAVTQYFLLGTPLSPVALLSLPIIVGGAISFSGNPFTETHMSLGIGAAFVSNIVLAFRNLAIKRMDSKKQSSLTLKLQKSDMLPILIGGIIVFAQLWYLQKRGMIHPMMPYTVLVGIVSATFHVVYSYVSTGLVLSQLSVVSHAVANIMKRVLVVLLLYMFGKRVASGYNFLGLIVCTVGLLLYAWDKQRKPSEMKSGGGSIKEKCQLSNKKAWAVILLSPFFMLSFVGISNMHSTHPLNQTFPVSNLYQNLPEVKRTFLSQLLGEAEEQTVFQAADQLKPLDAFADLTFGPNGFKRPENWQMEPELTGYLAGDKKEIQKFLEKRLIDEPPKSNYLSEKLQTSSEVIKEAQRIHYNVFEDAIGKYKYCMLLDTADFENKGDPAITIGEIYFLSRFDIEIIYYCSTKGCTDQHFDKAAEIAKTYSTDELVIIIHGGGNINGYPVHDEYRFKIFQKFRGFQFFIFPQSIWVKDISTSHFQKCKEAYSRNENLTIVLRDHKSYFTAKLFFNGTSRLLMAPDMAFHIGPVKRFISPMFDIMWIKRNDGETPGYTKIPPHPPHLRLHVSDWHKWYTPKSDTSLEKSFYATVMGLFFAQRGRVIVTDRIHGHIFATLLDIPHVLLDNKAKKLSSYHNTWTRGVKNTRLTASPEEAMKLALELLDIYGNDLSPRAPYLNISESFKNINYSLPEMHFP